MVTNKPAQASSIHRGPHCNNTIAAKTPCNTYACEGGRGADPAEQSRSSGAGQGRARQLVARHGVLTPYMIRELCQKWRCLILYMRRTLTIPLLEPTTFISDLRVRICDDP